MLCCFTLMVYRLCAILSVPLWICYLPTDGGDKSGDMYKRHTASKYQYLYTLLNCHLSIWFPWEFWHSYILVRILLPSQPHFKIHMSLFFSRIKSGKGQCRKCLSESPGWSFMRIVSIHGYLNGWLNNSTLLTASLHCIVLQEESCTCIVSPQTIHYPHSDHPLSIWVCATFQMFVNNKLSVTTPQAASRRAW